MSATGLQEGASPPSPRSFALAHRRPKHSFVGCSLIKEYDILGKLGEGTFGEVYRATCKRTGKQMALKKIIMHNEKDGFPITALREIKLLKLLSHKNVLSLQDMAVEHPPLRTTNSKKQKRPIMYMVTPYMDHDLSGMLDNPSIHLTIPQIKCYMLQLLEGVRYLHDNHILHRDMKAANLLISNKGILQIADFGLARHYEGGVPLPGKGGGETKFEYTSLVVTRWYRPPELLMQFRRYTTAIDMWGVGCVFGEMLHGKPILAGESDAHQLDIIFDLCGSPTDDNMPGWRDLPGGKVLKPRPRSGNLSTRFAKYGSGAVSLLRELLKLDYKARVNAMDALKHPYFQTAPHPILPGDLPTFEESHELDRRKFQDRSKVAALPPAPKGGDVGRGPGGDNNAGAGFNHRDNYSNRNGSANGGGRYPRGDSRHGPPNDERVPAWRLPPRPPPPVGNGNGASDHGSDGYRERDRDRGPPPRSRGGGGGPPPPLDRAPPGVGGGGGDTYFPDYKRDDRKDDRRRPPRDDRDDRHAGGWDRRRGPEYDDRPRNSRSRSPATHGWDRDRERDRDYRR